MLNLQPVTTTIVKVVPPPSEEVGVMDVLVGSLGLTGVIVIGSMVLGGLLGAAIILYKRRQDQRLPEGASDSAATRLDLNSR